jgi:putative nucleotidyltransferase with HDIG domain
MLARVSRPGDHTFTRRDAVRLLVASALLVVALTATLAADIVPTAPVYQLGEVAEAPVFAPRSVEYVSTFMTEQARDEARREVPRQFDFSADEAGRIAQEQGAELARLLRPINDVFATEMAEEDRIAALQDILPGLTDEARATLLSLTPESWSALRAEAARVLDAVQRTEIRESDLPSVRARLSSSFLGGLDPAERALAAEVVGPLLEANSFYSEETTRLAREQAASNVPVVRQTVLEGETIVAAGQTVGQLEFEQLQALGLTEIAGDVPRLLGWFVFSALLVSLLLAWLWRFRPRLWNRNNVLLLLGLMLAFTVFALKLTAGRFLLPYLLPVAAVGMLLTVLLDSGLAMILIAAIAIVGGAVNGNSLPITAYIFLGGLAGMVGIRRADRLSAFFQAAVAVAIVNVVVVSSFALLDPQPPDVRGVLELWGASALSAGGSAVAAIGLFAVLGNLFGILTAFQLLELANPSQPLLRRLLVETPGTYHHSIMVGNLAERAAEAIGADPLLTRVAAYYHDVGKLTNPAAFIENQAGGENIHDQLEPEVSAQVLKQHVVDGIDIAYRSRLPKALIAFIPQHHGTAIMSYFFARARDEAGGTVPPVDERRFRHAGPKPQSREAAIIMLADGVEASVRSLSSRDEPAIRAMVGRIIEERMADGQFDECDLTLRDIEAIREAFVGQLLGMYHQRIAYPQSKVVEIESRRAGGR